MVRQVDVQELARMRESGTPHALIDVREKGEFVGKQIFRAVPIPRGQLELQIYSKVPVRDIPVIVYCDDGHRSTLAADTLEQLGYSDVRILSGGLAAWEDAGYRVDYGTNVPGKDYGEKVAVQRRTPQLTPEEILERQRRGERIIVLDTRTREEYERQHVPGAYSVPGGELPVRIQGLLSEPENRDATFVVNCAGRTRSILGADVLLRMGLTNVYALENGTAAWRLSGYELEQGEGADLPPVDRPETRAEVQAFADRVAAEDGVQVLSIDELTDLRTSNPLHYILDVRLPEEYGAEHIPGSISLPAGQLALSADEIIAVNQAAAVFVSNGGTRAKIGASLARQLGYDNVYVLDGGLDEWKSRGLPTESGQPQCEVPGLDRVRSAVPSVDAGTLNRELQSQDPPRIIDVRSSGDYALGHIEGSRWVPRGDLERRIGKQEPSTAEPLVVVCDTGVRSSLAAATLRDLGYQSVRWLDGGLQTWLTAGYSTVEGLDGADISLKEAKDDVHMLGRRGPLARTREDMIAYLEWEIGLGHKYETA